MKSLISFFLLITLLFSCNKEKDYSITGFWERIAAYHKDTSGVFIWNHSSEYARWKYVVNFCDNGQCGAFSDILEWSGEYEYNYVTRELKFKNPSPGTGHTSMVSQLDKHYLIIDNYYNGTLSYKAKYRRLGQQ